MSVHDRIANWDKAMSTKRHMARTKAGTETKALDAHSEKVEAESADRRPAGLLATILKPKTLGQAHTSVLLVAIAIALGAGFVTKMAAEAGTEIFAEQSNNDTPETLSAVIKLVEAECRNNPGSRPSYYAGQENVQLLVQACDRVAGPAPIVPNP